ncbi:DNA-binding protein [Candidatus Peregrinibacteria bacterium]|jgi:uncharacterized protein|nr:DNA-binding protein [Candidatus Peregrinibacteria bacterium]MBT4055565.1 DNA-binding protein [Candidatus Peregrinibacteria bacterium]
MKISRFGKNLVVRIDKGEEIVENLKKACMDYGIDAGSVSGIGASNDAVIGFFDTGKKKYHSHKVSGDHEITSLTGNVSMMDGEVYLHLHIMLAGEDGAVVGGHLTSAVVSATCEIVVGIIDGALDRKKDEETGLNLLEF